MARATGYPHSEEMRITSDISASIPTRSVQHHHRIFKAYMKPIVAAKRIMKLKQGSEIEELPCVWADETPLQSESESLPWAAQIDRKRQQLGDRRKRLALTDKCELERQ